MPWREMKVSSQFTMAGLTARVMAVSIFGSKVYTTSCQAPKSTEALGVRDKKLGGKSGGRHPRAGKNRRRASRQRAAGRLLTETVRGIGHLQSAIPGRGEDILTRGRTHRQQALGPEREFQNLFDKLPIVFRDESRGARHHQMFGPTVGSDHGGHAGSGGFLDDVAEGVDTRRGNEEVHVGVSLREQLLAKNAGEDRVPQVAFEPGTLVAVTDHQERKIAASRGQQLALDVRQETNVLFQC